MPNIEQTPQDSVVRMMAWKERHPSVEFDLAPAWFAARLPGHDHPIGAMSLGRLLDKLEMMEDSGEL